ncbi:hypothetical protein MOQ_002858 [Trypanosoma cruzi marinkellei]|uniref:Uncharacterized protein n=1 Tax=Trypanosoma cruzi marinkellei TaxID=85056 RepID=K2NWI6_TRYCR|nr:hypothetical protein MOQ_002858 [Trypanosoma cruzi marinkellei]
MRSPDANSSWRQPEPQLQEREYQLGVARVQLRERGALFNAREVRQAARDAETTGREEPPTSRRGPTDGPDARHSGAAEGVTTQPQLMQRPMAGGAPLRTIRRNPTAERRRGIPQTSQDNFVKPRFHPSMPLPSRTSPLVDPSGAEEEEPRFCVFDADTFPTRIWNEGISGVLVEIRDAFNHWNQEGDQTKLAYENLVLWLGVLGMDREPVDRFMHSGRMLLQAFRMQLMRASDPSIPLSKFCAHLYTAVHESDAFARAT